MPKLILASVLLVLSINVLVLAGVAYNRWGDPVVTIELTERELPIHKSFARTDENSGTSLNLKWQVFNPDDDDDYSYSSYNSPQWLHDAKLTSLGFDINALKKSTKAEHSRLDIISNEVILVLEYQGETYRKALQANEQKLADLQHKVLNHPDDEKLTITLSKYENRLERFNFVTSRLYVIDAGLDLQALMKQYPQQGKYMFARGEIGLSWNDDAIEGRIKQLLIDNIHVSLPASERLSKLSLENRHYKYDGDIAPPRYRVKLKIGQRLEPWIESVVHTGDDLLQ